MTNDKGRAARHPDDPTRCLICYWYWQGPPSLTPLRVVGALPAPTRRPPTEGEVVTGAAIEGVDVPRGCVSELPLGGGWPCLLDDGHEGDHEFDDGEVTVTWSRRLDDFGNLAKHLAAGPS